MLLLHLVIWLLLLLHMHLLLLPSHSMIAFLVHHLLARLHPGMVLLLRVRHPHPLVMAVTSVHPRVMHARLSHALLLLRGHHTRVHLASGSHRHGARRKSHRRAHVLWWHVRLHAGTSLSFLHLLLLLWSPLLLRWHLRPHSRRLFGRRHSRVRSRRGSLWLTVLSRGSRHHHLFELLQTTAGVTCLELLLLLRWPRLTRPH